MKENNSTHLTDLLEELKPTGLLKTRLMTTTSSPLHSIARMARVYSVAMFMKMGHINLPRAVQERGRRQGSEGECYEHRACRNVGGCRIH
jgi:hypothetical protein